MKIHPHCADCEIDKKNIYAQLGNNTNYGLGLRFFLNKFSRRKSVKIHVTYDAPEKDVAGSEVPELI